MTSAPVIRQLTQARDLADRCYAEPLTVGDLAAEAAMSTAHFSREFKRTYGESPHAYLLTRRLERAATLLRVTNRSVADICCAVGLTSVGSFTASFTRVHGCSPTAYRARFPSAERFVRIPRCVAQAYARPQNRTFREDATSGGGLASAP